MPTRTRTTYVNKLDHQKCPHTLVIDWWRSLFRPPCPMFSANHYTDKGDFVGESVSGHILTKKVLVKIGSGKFCIMQQTQLQGQTSFVELYFGGQSVQGGAEGH